MGLVPVTMPQLGESVTEGTVDRWLKKVGDPVRRDEPLVEVVTDKVNAEIPSPFEGMLVQIDVIAGETVPVGSVIAQMEVAEEAATAPPRRSADEPETAASAPATLGPEAPANSSGVGSGRLLLSPAVRRLVEENGLDVSAIKSAGGGGRVTRADVLAAIAAAAVAQPVPEAGARVEAGGVGPQEELLQLTAVRRQIANHMLKSAAIPHAWGMREVDMTALVRYREEHKEDFRARHGIPLTFLPFIIQVVCDALRANPLLNSSWRDDGIILKHYINLGIAVALSDAVIVPVIKDADQMGLVDLARTVHDLTTRAREKKLRPENVQGGTFTLNNTGAIGGFAGMSIINHPQAAILNTELINRRPVARGDTIVLRDMMNLTLSFDHRIMDGLQAGRFMRMVQGGLENWTPAVIRL